VIKKLQIFWEKLPTWMKNPYLVTLILFAFWMLFADENSMISQFRRWSELSELKKKKQYYEQQIKITTTAYNELTANTESQEKFAREHYWMKRDNEDVFFIVQKEAE
jgi:cell division protein FtsB